jgi:hypothetical protein
MPARCWIAPEMPAAMYSCGATILPVWPTCQSLGRSPHPPRRGCAQAGAELVGQRRHHFVELLGAAQRRPPETMILAAVSSGRSLLAISRPTKLLLPLSATALAVSTAALPPVAAAGSKPVVRTVITLSRRALHDGNRVAGVDRALEGVGAVDLGDVADLADVQLGGHARGDVLAAGGGGNRMWL